VGDEEAEARVDIATQRAYMACPACCSVEHVEGCPKGPFPDATEWLRELFEGTLCEDCGWVTEPWYEHHKRFPTHKGCGWNVPSPPRRMVDDLYCASANHLYRRMAEEIFTYVLRDMTSPEGGFYSAEDADSEGVEGKFYVWSLDDLLAVLGSEEMEVTVQIFNVQPDGNFRDEAAGRKTGANILHRSGAGGNQPPMGAQRRRLSRKDLHTLPESQQAPHRKNLNKKPVEVRPLRVF